MIATMGKDHSFPAAILLDSACRDVWWTLTTYTQGLMTSCIVRHFLLSDAISICFLSGIWFARSI